MDKLLIKKTDIDHCRSCGMNANPSGFRGAIESNTSCSHFHTTDGWWLRVDHKRNSIFPDEIDKDVVGELLCPQCVEEKNSLFKDILDL